MIAFLLPRRAARNNRSALLPLRFADLVRTRLFDRTPLADIEKPPPIPPTKADAPNQLGFAYA